MVNILIPLLILSSTVPSLLMKDALSSALYIALNYWISPNSHKRYYLATYPKLQTITSKALMHRLIISYRVRDLTNHFLKWIHWSVNWNLVNDFLFYTSLSFSLFLSIFLFQLFYTPRYFLVYWFLASYLAIVFMCVIYIYIYIYIYIHMDIWYYSPLKDTEK